MGNKDGIFRYADRTDKLLMFFGTLGSMGDGLQIPLMMFVLSGVINEYGDLNAKVSMSTVNTYALKLLYVAILVGLSAFIEGLCWARTAERQSSRMRLEYLKSVLKQEVGFFDSQTADSSTTYQIVSTISSDSSTIQVTIGEKIPDCVAYMSSFFFCLVFAFSLSWKLTLAAIPFTLMFIVPALAFGKMMMDVAIKTIESYAVAGGIAEQAVSSIRTVYSYVAVKFGKNLKVGQFGVQLSGGQKQRIAIARALIRDPKILLLDEATSALDTESERVVQKAIDEASKGRTTIVIAHRLSTIKTANLIVVLKSGQVVESGSHDELMQINSGDYLKMVELQQSSAPPQSNGNSTNTTPRNNGRNQHRMSSPRTPALHPFSPAFSRSGPFSAPYSIQYELGCLGAIGSGAVQPINAYCVGALISVYFRTDTSSIPSHARGYSLVFVGLGVFNFFTNLLQHYSFAIMGERLTKRVREMLLQKIMTFEIGWFDQDSNTSAAISARLSTEANMVRSLVGDRMSLLAQAIFGATFAYVLGLYLSWKLALVMMAAQPLLIGSFYMRSVLIKSMSAKAQQAQKEGSQLASEAVINHRTITAFSSQKRIVGLFRDTLEGPRKESIRQSWFAGAGLFSSQFLAAASTSLAYWYGGKLLSQGKISPENLFQAFLALLFTAYTIAEAGSMTNDISRGSSAVGSVFSILDRTSEIDPEVSWRNGEIRRGVRGRVELKNVVFAYPSRPEQMILKGLSLKISAGTTVALVGQSGSGKSTIVSLIERFYDPINGSVLIDEKDVRDYNLRALRSHIGLVSQEPTLFAGTIYENIAYGRKDARESEIRKAAICGERGVQLSGGQKQRIALARAILKDPAILLLDEATSALDSVSESLVQEALEKMMVGRTCIVVAHRLSTIQKSNAIAVIKDGRVVEQGSHSDLLAMGNRSTYFSLVKPQHRV